MKELLIICERWSIKNGMTFAAQKCVAIAEENIHNYKIYNTPISAELNPKYLGIPMTRYGIDLATNIDNRTKKAIKVSHALAESGMNITGFPQEASVRLYKCFIRPILEYGMQLDILDKESIVKAQRVQNSVLRTIFGTHRFASIAALHKLAQVPFIIDRNKYLCTRFYKHLLNGDINTTSNPAIKFIHNAKRSQDINSLYLNMLAKNDLLRNCFNQEVVNNQFWNNSQQNDQALVNNPKKDHYRKNLEDLDEDISKLKDNKPSVATAIKLAQYEHPRVIFTSQVKFERKEIRTALIKWLTGGVAQHQECKRCGEIITRKHAIRCSGVGSFITNYFNYASRQYTNMNKLDSLINYYRLETNTTIYKIIFKCIQAIYVNCLGYQQKSNGFYAAIDPQEENNDNIITNFQIETEETMELVSKIRGWGIHQLPEKIIQEAYQNDIPKAKAINRNPTGRVYTEKGRIPRKFLPKIRTFSRRFTLPNNYEDTQETLPTQDQSEENLEPNLSTIELIEEEDFISFNNNIHRTRYSIPRTAYRIQDAWRYERSNFHPP